MIRRWLKPLICGLAVVWGSTGFAGKAHAQKNDQSHMIDELLKKSWEANDLKPSERCNDYTFVRRAFIDLIGRIPSSDEVRDFINDSSTNKRQKLVKRLLNAKEYPLKVDGKDTKVAYNEAYAQHWSNIWTIWLMTRGGLMERYHEGLKFWLETEILSNTPYDKMVYKLITATGKSTENGAVNFILSHMGEASPADKKISDGPFEMVPLTSRVTKIFLGIQTQCTQCHDHPFNPEWGQENFWGVNAFFRQVSRDKTPTPKTANAKKDGYVPVTISDDASANKSGTVYYEKRSGVLVSTKPVFLPDLSELDKDKADRKEKMMTSETQAKSRRELAAEFVIGHDNFAKAYVNRIWAQLFGRGLNETAAFDDFGNHNKVVHAELLDKLAAAFKTYGYDTKLLLEWICCSDAYSLSYVANEKNKSADKEAYFSRMLLKAMSPEVLFESLMEATKAGAGVRRDELRDRRQIWQQKLVNNFGDDEGNEVSFNGTIVQALLMMNGDEINKALNSKGASVIERAIARHKVNDQEIIKELYYSALSRPMSTAANIPVLDKKTGKPTGSFTSESKFVMEALLEAKKTNKLKEFYNDLFWSLLNTNEFILNH
ncbi:DUF1549 domain-containing protein [Telmatocola sphagniphila]|uniref:DUF1549 domain-containing protein n=1 Tax=Telmatocola sphagniphila TaxID=1123043 RepID=A0A8E6EYX0_9BACT|nr:DUF1549 domain-containing protein [Telmatocola sphagniphila]QVL33128.1 DUF1549 domain-containing protein [Telmatocola sphagniphila]